jgi:hypothetical protein
MAQVRSRGGARRAFILPVRVGVLHLAYRGPRQVTLTTDGVLTFPTWFGLGTGKLHLADVVEAHTGSETIVLKCRSGLRGAGWSRVLYGGRAIAELSFRI